MIHRATLIWLCFAALAGVALYNVKFKVQALEDEMVRLNRDILTDQAAIHVLKAEWSFLNAPERLRKLSDRHLDLGAPDARQTVKLELLPARLDAPAARPPAVKPSGGTPVLANLKASQ